MAKLNPKESAHIFYSQMSGSFREIMEENRQKNEDYDEQFGKPRFYNQSVARDLMRAIDRIAEDWKRRGKI